MSSMTGFTDEMIKISASMCATRGSKARSGRRPIRAAKLVKKAQSPVVQGGGALSRSLPFLKAHHRTLGVMGGTAAGVLGIQRGIEDIRMAEQMRAAMKNRQ
jgi:hypothetical protein